MADQPPVAKDNPGNREVVQTPSQLTDSAFSGMATSLDKATQMMTSGMAKIEADLRRTTKLELTGVAGSDEKATDNKGSSGSATTEKPSKAPANAEKSDGKPNIVGGLFNALKRKSSEKDSMETPKPIEPNPARDDFFKNQHEKFAHDLNRRIEKARGNLAVTDHTTMKTRRPEDKSADARRLERDFETWKTKESAKAEYSPPHVIDIDKDAGFLLKQAIGKTVKEIAIGGPNNDIVRIELNNNTSTILRPIKEDSNQAKQPTDPKTRKEDPEAVKMDFERVLAFKLKNIREPGQANKIILEALDSVGTGITVSKPFRSWSETSWSEMTSYIKSKGWGSLNKLTISQVGEGENIKHNGVANVSAGGIPIREDVPIGKLQFALLSKGINMILNTKDTNIVRANPNHLPRLSSN